MKICFTCLSLFIAASFTAFRQACNCRIELNYIKAKIEKNYAGFNDKVNSQTKPGYDHQMTLALEQAKSITNPAYCIALMNEWLKFFKDGHIQIGRDRVSNNVEKSYLKIRRKSLKIHLLFFLHNPHFGGGI